MKSECNYNIFTIHDIPHKNEGWVYLLHAQGTNRYKIGRSVNPVARHQALNKQSPLSLTFLDCFWTVDCVEDEECLHVVNHSYRIHGEWFEFETDLTKYSNPLKAISSSTLVSSTLFRLINSAAWYLHRLVQEHNQGIDADNRPIVELVDLFEKAQSRSHLELIHNFIYTEIPNRIEIDQWNHRDYGTKPKDYTSYIAGMLGGLTLGLGGKK
jgi:hypothetical protein